MHYPQTLLVQQGQVSHTHTICARELNEHSIEVNDYSVNNDEWAHLTLPCLTKYKWCNGYKDT